MNVVNLQKIMGISLKPIPKETLFVVDVPINWASNRKCQTKVLDTGKVTHLD